MGSSCSEIFNKMLMRNFAIIPGEHTRGPLTVKLQPVGQQIYLKTITLCVIQEILLNSCNKSYFYIQSCFLKAPPLTSASVHRMNLKCGPAIDHYLLLLLLLFHNKTKQGFLNSYLQIDYLHPKIHKIITSKMQRNLK